MSEVSTYRIPKVDDVFKVGDKVLVMVKEIDDMNRVNLTRRRILENEAGSPTRVFLRCASRRKGTEETIAALAGGKSQSFTRQGPPTSTEAGGLTGETGEGSGPRHHSSGGRNEPPMEVPVKVKIVREEGKELPLPEYATPFSAGVDLRAADDCVLLPSEWTAVPTGLRIRASGGIRRPGRGPGAGLRPGTRSRC